MSPKNPDHIEANGHTVVEQALKRHHFRPDALIEILHTVQAESGYLDRQLLGYVAERLNLPPSLVYGVASFYHAFRLEPRGRRHCTVCTGTSCHIQGGTMLVAELEQRLGVPCGTTAADGSISLDTVRCLGSCGLAPLVTLDGDIVSGESPVDIADQVCRQLAKVANGATTP